MTCISVIIDYANNLNTVRNVYADSGIFTVPWGVTKITKWHVYPDDQYQGFIISVVPGQVINITIDKSFETEWI